MAGSGSASSTLGTVFGLRQTSTDLQYRDAAALSDPEPRTDHYLAADVRA
jgi:hypothetical protein